MNRQLNAGYPLRYAIAAVATIIVALLGCSEEHATAPQVETLLTPVTGPTSVVADVLGTWPAPSQIVQMAPPAFICYGTRLFYGRLEVSPNVFRRIEFTFCGSSPTDVYTLQKFSIYIEDIRSEPVFLNDQPLTLIPGLGAGMLMSEASALLGSPDESDQDSTTAHWTYLRGEMVCRLAMAPDLRGDWRIFNLEFEFGSS